MEVPEVRYVVTDDDVRIAYQDFGDGRPVVVLPALGGHLEGYWDFAHLRRLYERMAANVRVLIFDNRGNGMSDGFADPPSLNDRTLDVKAVMDVTGLDRAALFGFDFGSQLAIGFAVRFPERVDRMVLANSRVGRSVGARALALNPDVDPSDLSGRSEFDEIGVSVDEAWTHTSPSLAKHPDLLKQMPKFERMVGPRDVWKRQMESALNIDVAGLAPQVTVPTLITHTVGDRSFFHVGYSRVLSQLIPDSTLVEFDGDDHMYWMGDNWTEIADAQIRFLTGSEVEAPVERSFAAVVFTDIVESTSTSLSAGDNEWRDRLDTHDRITRQIVERNQGQVIKHTGDGIVATFTLPSQAIDATVQMRDELSAAGIPIRAGIHAGEIEIRQGDISGAVVNLAARVEQVAPDGEIYVTKAVRDMTLGSTHHYEPAGEHALKGFDETWHLHRLTTQGAP